MQEVTMNDQDIDIIAGRLLSQQVSLFQRFFDKFTPGARKALVFAEEEAALLNHNYIGTEHLLMGLLREEKSIASQILKGLGIELQAVQMIIKHIVGVGEAENVDVERNLTPRAQVVVTMAIGESWRSSSISTEHLLLGLAREGEGLAAAAIENLGVSLDQLRMRIYQVLIQRGTSGEPLKDIIKGKTNVVACRVDNQDLDVIDALIEVGIRLTRSDAASWLIHAGIEANQPVLESVYGMVAEIRQLRTKAQAMAQQVMASRSSKSDSEASPQTSD
jgi:ATP-dependent Clp protease ATP-binding subunit ClpA